MLELDVSDFCNFISKYAERLQSLEGLLNDLDNRIGDGDHGTNIARGFVQTAQQLTTNMPNDLSSAANIVGMTLIAKVGGASGPLYGTAFLRLSSAWRGIAKADVSYIQDGFSAALAGLKSRGKADVGDKTMVDVWSAFVRCFSDGTGDEHCLRGAARSGIEAAFATKELVARKGRAAYLGERSRGTTDPGSVSSAILFERLVDEIVGGVEETQWHLSALC